MTQLLSQNLPVRPIFLVVNDTIKFSSVIGGIVLVCFASMSILLGVEPKTLLTQVRDILGEPFLILTGLLTATAITAILKVADQLTSRNMKKIWLQIGIHASNGVATLALTFTLFGISSGIGQLTAGSLNIEEINSVIASLTDEFSMAFMTSVIGLPLSALLRVAVAVTSKSHNF
mgnify:CR=1 FL=1